MQFFYVTERSVLLALAFYYKDMVRVEIVTMQRAQQFSAFLCYRENPVNAAHAQLLEKLRPIR